MCLELIDRISEHAPGGDDLVVEWLPLRNIRDDWTNLRHPGYRAIEGSSIVDIVKTYL